MPLDISKLLPTEEKRQKAYASGATVEDVSRLPFLEVTEMSKGNGPNALVASQVLDNMRLLVLNVFAAAAGLEPLTSLDDAPRVKEAIADHITTFGGLPDDPKWQEYPIEHLREQADFVRIQRTIKKQDLEPETAAQLSGYAQTEFFPVMMWGLNSNKPTPSVTVALPKNPPIPNTEGCTWDDLFDWFYRGGQLYGFPNIKDLAKSIPHAVGTINNNHSNYAQQYGKRAMPDNKSRFVGMVPIVNIIHDDE